MLHKKRGDYSNTCPKKEKDEPTNIGQDCNTHKKACDGLNLTPAQALVIGGILTGALDIYSFAIDVNQDVEISLIGSLKSKKEEIKDEKVTDIENILETLGSLPLDDVLKGILDRLCK